MAPVASAPLQQELRGEGDLNHSFERRRTSSPVVLTRTS